MSPKTLYYCAVSVFIWLTSKLRVNKLQGSRFTLFTLFRFIFTINFDRILASMALFPLQINIIWICFVRYIPFYFLLINDTRKGKTVFYSIRYMNGCLASSDLFHMFTQSMKFYTFHYHVLNSTDV